MFEDERRIGRNNRLIPMLLLIAVIILLLVDPAPAATLLP